MIPDASGGQPPLVSVYEEVWTVTIARPRGTNDILPGESEQWQVLEEAIHRICQAYGYREIRTPIFEHTELFERGIGETTDIVSKEMYTFSDRGQRSLTLRPEGTAPVVRSFLEHKLYGQALPTKLYYVGPMFRYERPQAGRYRQFYQFGVEAFGSGDPALDVEIIAMPIQVYKELGLETFEVCINTIGCPDCRPAYREALRSHLADSKSQLCRSCQTKYDRSPMRILDCKEATCQELTKDAPLILDYLCSGCRDHFAEVKRYLELLEVDFVHDPRLVRGFDYYTKTVFEIKVESLGAQDAVGGGGRYDRLVEEMGGPPTAGVGYGVGMERVLLALQQQAGDALKPSGMDGFLAQFGGATKEQAVVLAHRLRALGLKVDLDYLDRSLKAQMKAANRSGARWVMIIGQEELENNQARIRWMYDGTEEAVDFDTAAQYLAAKGKEPITQ